MTATADPRRALGPRRRPRAGFSVVEFLVILVVFGMGVVTLYGMFGKTQEEAFRSKWAYLSAHAAREELEAIRTLNLFGKDGSDPYTGHDWRDLRGTMLVDLDSGGTLDRSEFEYPIHYSRIETKVEITGDPAARALVITLYVRYQQKGADRYGLQSKDGKPLAIGTYRTVIANRDFR